MRWFPLLALSVSAAMSQPLVEIETVLVGDAGNFAPTNSPGAVAYDYRIGKFEVTIAQYAAFLNAVAASDPHGFYDTRMATDLQVAGISRSGYDGSYSYATIGPYGSTPAGASSPGNRPITYVDWFDAVRFCNWLHNGATNGADTETGAYSLTNAYGLITRNEGAKWWLPSEDEWHKAAFYKKSALPNSDYSIYPFVTAYGTPRNDLGTDTATDGHANYKMWNFGVGYVFSVTQTTSYSAGQNYLTDVGAFSNSPSPWGTFDQGGNVYEWCDSLRALGGVNRVARGGYWGSEQEGHLSASGGVNSLGAHPTNANSAIGFRVARSANFLSVPLIISNSKGSNGFSITWMPAASFHVQRRSSLTEGQWEVVSSNNSSTNFLDTNPPAGKAFYRLVVP